MRDSNQFCNNKLTKLVNSLKRQNVYPEQVVKSKAGRPAEITSRNVTLQCTEEIFVISYTLPTDGDAMYIFAETRTLHAASNAFADCFRLNMKNTGR